MTIVSSASSKRFDVIAPATGDTVASLAPAGVPDALATVEATHPRASELERNQPARSWRDPPCGQSRSEWPYPHGREVRSRT